MRDFTMTLELEAPAGRVYDAIMHADRSWTKHVTISESPGSILDLQFPKAGFFAKMKLLSAEPGRRVEWECIDSRHPENSGFHDLKDWMGTTLRFEIAPDGDDRSELKFTHFRLAELECHGVCSSTWGFYLNVSLRAYVETGRGKPFDDANFGH